MKVSRRKLLMGAGATAIAQALPVFRPAVVHGQTGQSTPPPPQPPLSSGTRTGAAPAVPRDGRFVPVRTLNGWTLPWRMNNGIKEFHLVAEEIVHEFAAGSKATCWGYNGTTPGPTIEAVEGDRVRIFVTNHLKEPTTIHWHGLILPNGMDGVGGLNQPKIQPGETFAYEYTLVQHGTHMYHPHADEMTQMAYGMMGLYIIHPRRPERLRVDRDYAFLLHNWALHPGTWRPDPSIMTDFDLWTFNSKVFPAIESLVARTGERVRIRIGNLSMWNHPIHLHGVEYFETGSDGGRWPEALWRREVTSIVGVGQMRDIEFIAMPGDWALHCHMAHHTMNAMGHDIPNTTGVDQSGVEARVREMLPGYMAMGRNGMSEHQDHTTGGMPGPPNTLPMMMGVGPFGNIEMGGMFTVVKVRNDLAPGEYADPGFYAHPEGTVAARVSDDPNFGSPPRRYGTITGAILALVMNGAVSVAQAQHVTPAMAAAMSGAPSVECETRARETEQALASLNATLDAARSSNDDGRMRAAAATAKTRVAELKSRLSPCAERRVPSASNQPGQPGQAPTTAAPAATPAPAPAPATPAVDHAAMGHGAPAAATAGAAAAPTTVRAITGPAEDALQAFQDALQVGNREVALRWLAPDVTVAEGGATDASRDAYAKEHMGIDMAFLKTAKVIMLDRQVHPGDSSTHIVTTSRVTGRAGEIPVDVTVTEGALLKHLPQGWRIASIEWSIAPASQNSVVKPASW